MSQHSYDNLFGLASKAMSDVQGDQGASHHQKSNSDTRKDAALCLQHAAGT